MLSCRGARQGAAQLLVSPAHQHACSAACDAAGPGSQHTSTPVVLRAMRRGQPPQLLLCHQQCQRQHAHMLGASHRKLQALRSPLAPWRHTVTTGCWAAQQQQQHRLTRSQVMSCPGPAGPTQCTRSAVQCRRGRRRWRPSPASSRSGSRSSAARGAAAREFRCHSRTVLPPAPCSHTYRPADQGMQL